ncbi:MAG: amino acid adenylation domain-containing protein [Gemmatimonadota bacterium]
MYRTGDRVRWTAAGEIEFLGRVDQQAKIRGFRIEPGEVEAALMGLPEVGEAFVTVREDAPGNRRLAAYLVPAGGAELSTAGLRARLAARLPEYLVPSAFTVMERLPLNANGKVDRRALPAPEQAAEAAFVVPRTPAEEVLAGIWAEVLGVERVGAETGFFELGGHSLLATQVVSRVRQAFGVEVPLRALFEAPTVAGLAGRIEALRGAGTPPAPPIERVSRDGPLPLSFAQQRLWVLDRLEPGSAAYNMPGALRLRGPLHAPALRAAVAELVRRHEALRTTFAEQGGAPVQVVRPPAPLPLPLVDLRALPGAARERHAERLASVEARRPFDFARGPLLRTTLVRLGDEDHVLLLTLHHVVSDGWSMGVLVREVFALYDAFSRGGPSPLPELPVQYADYAVWQRRWLSGEALERQLAWWRERLAAAPPLLELPTDRPRPALPRHRGAACPLHLDAALAGELRALGRREGVTLFMTLLAGFAVVLGRWAGQEDVVVGTPIAGRTRRETEGLIGFFLNTLALRTDLSGNPSFRALLGRVREATLGAYAHQDLPFERILEELQPARSLSHSPLFQVMLNVLNLQEEGRSELPGLAVERFGEHEPMSKFDLTLYVGEGEGGIRLNLVYDADLFEGARMAELLAQLRALLTQAARDPDRALASYTLRTPAARAVLPDPALPLPAAWHGPVHALFAAQARRAPERTALREAGAAWTYGELEARSNQLAHRLLARGLGRGETVAVYAERSAALVWAMLGVLGAGGAFVVLDPAYPPARLARQLAAARPRVLLRVESAGALPAEVEAWLDGAGAARLDLPALPDARRTGFPGEHPSTAPEVDVGPEDVAYVAFTSGTTGEPRGIVGTHRPLSHFVAWQREAFGLGEEDRFALLSGLAHDPLLRDVFTPLSLGATLCIPDPRRMGTPGYLARWLAEEAVGAVHLTPAMGQLLREGGGGGLPALRHVFWGGDKVRAGDVAALRERAPAAESVVFYGATETPQAVSYFPVPRQWRGPEVLPVGRGIAAAQLLVLRPGGGLAGVGEVGEICVRTPHLARGYLHDEAGTRERFVGNPFGGDPEDRMYRTGDLGRYRPDGAVQILGRADAQVKVRGFRIEPGEVEAALREHRGVREAVVVLREEAGGEARLVGYVAAGEEGPSAAELREHARARLPEHMVPGAIVVLESIPLTPNGKVDRRALPAPESPGTAEHEAPRTATEEVLAGMWAETLRRERVGVTEDFFALGGHSLLAMRLVSRLREAFGVEVPLRALFEASTVARLAARIDALRSAGAPPAPPIARVPRDGPLPPSFAQQRLWLVDRIEPGSAAYNMPFALRMRGALDVAALRASLDALVRRHETLRTTFAEQDGAPVQVIHPPAGVALVELDLGELPPPGREAEAERLAAEEALRPFDLARGPLLRCTLLRLGHDDHVLCLTLHHVVSDGWSMQVLTRDVTALYAAFSRGETPRLPELPVQYADYAVWQRERLRGETLEAQVGFWKERLADAPPLLEIPLDHPRRVGLSPREASLPFLLPAGVSDGLRALSRREGATLFMTVLAAWQALLGRWAGQEDVVVGTPIAGRSRHETEGLIGFFVNVLALRGDLSGDPTWGELLGRVRGSALGAYAHQELPFERLVEELATERSLTHSPVFQATFALNRLDERERLSLGELELASFGARGGVARYDLGLVVSDRPEALGAALEYREALFDAGTVARMAGHLEALLEAMVEAPGRRISGASLLRGAERAHVLEAWNATAADFPRDRCIHELVAEQAARTPEAVAVAAGGGTLTYAELERRSDRLAHRLAALGVRPEARVGLCLERGPEMVVGLLAVLKAGGAYVPLDPAYPAERLAYMLGDSGASVLLTQAALAAALPDFAGARICLDEVETAFGDGPTPAPARAASPGNAAYVIYTSGSTGTPKGVVVPHRAVVNFLDSMRLRPGLSARDTLLAVTTLSFDIAALELFLPLTTGARVVLADRETASDGARLRDAVAASGATVMQATPASWRMLLDAGWEGAPGLKALCGGEALPRELADRLLGAVGELWNLYGPTETTIWSTVERVEPGAGAVSIGAPVANTRLYLLDRGLEPVPAGVPGELYVGGEGVARGYLGRPELTAERFVPDAFSRGPGGGARLYRTGDRVRRRADGALEYLGRTDTQVKVRGFRIEPGEIEAALRALPQVREAVAVVREGPQGDRRLVAYVVAGEGAPAAAELRAALRERLPEHMVPGAFVVLESIPLTPNGKVDRRALPAPERAAEDEYVAPRTPAEELLAGIWAELLGTGRVGVEESFFDLGGHSLLATRVVSRARQAFGVEVPLRALFEAPTVAGLAGRIEVLRSTGAAAGPPIERAARGGPLPVSFAQQRLWVVDRLDPRSPAYNLFSALRLHGALDTAALRASLDALVRRHETLRTTFAEQDGAVVQVIHPAAPVPLPVLDLRELPEAEREQAARGLAGEESLRPFDLARGPLLRATLLRLGDTEHVLCFTMHHVVSDGWSMQVLTREVTALYAAFSRGEEPRLPELPVQYADYAVWQRAWLSGAVLEEQLGFWRDRLGGAPPLLTLPTDRPRSSGRSARAGTHRFGVAAGVSRGLRALSRRAGTTLFMTLLAAWQSLLGRYAGQEDVVVGTPIAGRTRTELEGLIGFFVNMLALRADLGADPTWTELLEQVRDAVLGAFDHQELPFERLVDELVTERSPTHSPLFQVVFALDRSGMREELSLGGVELEPFGRGEKTARFDLTLTMTEAEEELGGTLTYRAGLYEEATAARMAAHLEVLLEAMASAPGRRLSEVPLLRGAEREQLLHAWNGPDTGYTGELCIHELVHAQLLRTPGAPALRFEGRSLTYAELYARAAQLANRLRREGVGPETRVAICMEPAPEVVVSVLGVLLAGGAYLPLDPELPPERRAYVLGDAAPVLLLTQAALAERLREWGVPLLAVDAEAETIARESTEAPQTGVGPDNLAYVIYTSGSTGRPKGVLVEHRGVGNTFLELGRVYGAGAGERNLAYAPLFFDASVADLFTALCSGAELVLARREAMLPGEDLLRTLREERITHLKIMPSALAVTPVEPLPELKAIVTGGETLAAELVRRWGAGRKFFNGYGATEAGIRMTSSAYTADAGDPPIGRPVANTQLHVLDAQLEPVPPGVAGELYIGGVGMARGYLGRPDLTAERFLPDPHRGVAGARLYRTGDVGRRRADGEVEFLGRTDHQVKVRGYRVELGEIEAVLRGHGQVREAAVLLREDVPGQPRLVAYVAGEAGAELTAAELRGHLAGLRAHLAERLPEYMVPGAFVVLEQLPVTSNGKIDRRALPAPERASGEEHVAPRTAVEELVAEIWAELLRLETVGVTENFFELGGHSLLATQVVSRLRKTLGIEVPLSALFEQPTVEALARVVEDRLIGTLDADRMAEHLELDPEQDPDALAAPDPAAR